MIITIKTMMAAHHLALSKQDLLVQVDLPLHMMSVLKYAEMDMTLKN